MAYVDLNTKWGRTSDIRARARKEVIALNKEGFESVKVSTPLLAIQICALGILNIHDPKRIFRAVTWIRSSASAFFHPPRSIDSQT